MHIFRGNIIFLSHLNLSGQLPELYLPVEETHWCSRCKRCSFVASIPPLLILHVIMKNRCSQGPLKLWFHVLKPRVSFQNFVSLNLTTGIDLDMAVYFLSVKTPAALSPGLLLLHLIQKSKLLLASGQNRSITELQSWFGVQPPLSISLADWFTETLLTMAVLGLIKTFRGGNYRGGMAQTFPCEFLCTSGRAWVSHHARIS